jgi:hypothetical protein
MPQRQTSKVGVVNLLFFLAEESARLRMNVKVRQFHLRNEFRPDDLNSLREHLMAFRELESEVAGTALVFKRSGRRLPGFTKQLNDLSREIRYCIAKGDAAYAANEGSIAKVWVQNDAKDLLVRVGVGFDRIARDARKSIEAFVIGTESNHYSRNGARSVRRSRRIKERRC